MSEQTPDIETVLAEHSTVATGLGEWCCKCSPGEWRPTAHRSSHVAQALAPVLAAAVREAIKLPADGHAPGDASAVVAGSEREVAAVPSAGFNAAARIIAEATADRVTWDDGTEYINIEDAARVLAAAVREARAAALDDVLRRADEGIEFGPRSWLLLHRIIRDVRADLIAVDAPEGGEGR